MKNSQIKLLIDAGPLANGNKSGVGYYTYHLVDSLARYYPKKLKILGHYFNFLGLKQPALPKYINLEFRTSRLLPGKAQALARRAGFQHPFDWFIKNRGDIAVFPNFVSLPMLHKAKKVIVVHDLAFMDRPEFLQKPNLSFLERFVPRSVASADLIIAVSSFTKSRLIHHFRVPPEKIIVTPIAPQPAISKPAPKPSLRLPAKYILFISTLEPRKNLIGLVRAYEQLPAELKKQYGLVVAGGKGWDTDETMKLIYELRAKGENIIVCGYVDEDTRTYLYQHASLFVMPSHYEGFGMPILEAVSYKVPVAVSDIEVFHETAGNAVVYFDQNNPNDIAKVMAKVLNDPKKQTEMAKNGLAQLKKFSWKTNSNHIMEAFEKLVSEPTA